MAFPERLLGRDEHVVRHMREHPKTLFWHGCGLVFIAIIAMLLIYFLPASLRPWSTWVVIGFAGFTAIVVWVVPWLRWSTATYTITNRRIITRSGIFSKSGHDIPLSRISNVAYDQGILDRLVGAGTLILETSASEPLTLQDVPSINRVHVELTELLFADDDADAED
ncbi:PH domain-containing protein [Arcanobacterium phocae]|uniref:PH domain-containing protein n=1 Tax=Arcanobacterium phocae TaxID=131112 RepID=UPI001C0EE9E2|nr:PH domain-containing protein [Arcanobacterium phocae]